MLIVALLGLTMRYKIAFSLPFIDQKHLLHAHSHFAFTGWITQALMAILVSYIFRRTSYDTVKKYKPVLIANLVASYGMLLSFPVQGYGLFSISFSTLSIFTAYYFAFLYWRDLRFIRHRVTHLWFKAALVFNVISSAGAFSQAYMMATSSINQHGYLAAVYYFLHFQYNGWFFFAAMGLLSNKLLENGAKEHSLKKVFWLFASSCVPAYFLSVLWLKLPVWVYVLIVASVLLQLVGWAKMVVVIKTQLTVLKTRLTPLSLWLLGFSGFALTIKLILQAGSVFPELSTISYSFRPIIIGYLHLVLLGVFTLFILGYTMAYRIIIPKRKAWLGVVVFTAGIILNEVILLIQGVTAMNYYPIPYMNEALFVAAAVMFAGLLLIMIMVREPRLEEKLPLPPAGGI